MNNLGYFKTSSYRTVVPVKKDIHQIFCGGDKHRLIVRFGAKHDVKSEIVIFADGLVQVSSVILLFPWKIER